ncbi:RNA-binding protein 33 [Acipenser ruthenus]|uniref:RNA-binding protein 33 n=1 Tax=Acipenser ruthenus TaxID=7906 RepID=A0A662YKF7_ACIRT|nr:RNA-binding protein 33 [Acipenser ruthenus]
MRTEAHCGSGGEGVVSAYPVGQPQRGQLPQQQRQQPARKVTLGKATVQQQLKQQQTQFYQPHPEPQGVRNNLGNQPQNRVVMQGRGRAAAGQMGRGRLMPNKQNLRVVEPQPCVVSIEGLSSSTTDVQLKNLLMSVGPIQVGHLFLSASRCQMSFSQRRLMIISAQFTVKLVNPFIQGLCLSLSLSLCLVLQNRKTTLFKFTQFGALIL